MTDARATRSMLYMPIVERRFVDSAWRRGSDAIILDLEDSVPRHLKAEARSLVKESIHSVAQGGAMVYVRINSDSVEEDLEASVWPGLCTVIRPKAEQADDVIQVDRILSKLERERSIEAGSVQVWPLIETALGVKNAYDVASASSRVKLFGGGNGYDMSLDLGVAMFVGFDQFFYSRSETELIARSLDLELIGGLYFEDTSGAVADPEWVSRYAKAMKGCALYKSTLLHPGVIEVLNEGLTPTTADVEDARQTILRHQQMLLMGKISDEIDGRVVDRFEAGRARKLIAWADTCAKTDAEKADAVFRTQRSIEESTK